LIRELKIGVLIHWENINDNLSRYIKSGPLHY
jgi:hypothetical protein